MPIQYDELDISPPDYDKVCLAFKKLKTNIAPGADGISEELFKTLSNC